MDLLKKIESLGVWFVVEGESVKARVSGQMSEEAKQLIKDNKDEIKQAVLQRETRLQEYLTKAILELKQKGIVFIYSSVLGEQIAFIMSVDQAHKLEPGTVFYTISELDHLKNNNYEGWKQVHRTKKLFGGVIVDVKGEDRSGEKTA